MWIAIGLGMAVVTAYIVGIFVHKRIDTSIEIDASPSTVWQHLTDFENYPEWNPFIKRLSGEAKVDAVLDVTVVPPESKPMDFTPRIVTYEVNKEFRWLGRLGIPHLFDGEHYFRIERVSDEQVRFEHGESFNGIFALLVWKMVEPGTRQGFLAMNEALKARSEA